MGPPYCSPNVLFQIRQSSPFRCLSLGSSLILHSVIDHLLGAQPGRPPDRPETSGDSKRVSGATRRAGMIRRTIIDRTLVRLVALPTFRSQIAVPASRQRRSIGHRWRQPGAGPATRQTSLGYGSRQMRKVPSDIPTYVASARFLAIPRWAVRTRYFGLRVRIVERAMQMCSRRIGMERKRLTRWSGWRSPTRCLRRSTAASTGTTTR